MLPPGFDPQPVLENAALRLRPLRAGDVDSLYKAAQAPETWAGHPARDRYKREVFEGYFGFLLDSGTTLVVIERDTSQIIGCSRYYAVPDQPGSVAVGFTFLDHRWWGGATNRSLKELMLGHAFATVPEVWFHIAPSNIRSQKATAKLGAVHAYDATLDLSGSQASWMCFCLTRVAWEQTRAAPGGSELRPRQGRLHGFPGTP